MLLSRDKNKRASALFLLLVLFLPTQLGLHIWPAFSYVAGLRIDYLSLTFFVTDGIILLLFLHECIFFSSLFTWQRIRWAVVIGAFFFLRSLFSFSPLNSLFGLLKVAEFVFVGFFISHKKFSEKEKSLLLFILSTALIFEIFLVFFQFLHGGSLGGLLYWFGERTYSSTTPGIANVSVGGQLILRPYGTFSHPNVLAGFLILYAQLITGLLKKSSLRLKNLFLFVIMAVGTISILATFSRPAYYVWLGYILLLGWSLYKKQARFLIPGILSFTILIVFFFPSIVQRLIDLDSSSDSFALRAQLLSASLGMIQSYWALGVGIHNFLPLLPRYLSGATSFALLQPVHNIYVLILAETGLFGLFIFCFCIAYALALVKKNHTFLLCGIPLLSILFIGFFDHYFVTLQQGQLLFCLVLGLCYNKSIQRYGS